MAFGATLCAGVGAGVTTGLAAAEAAPLGAPSVADVPHPTASMTKASPATASRHDALDVLTMDF